MDSRKRSREHALNMEFIKTPEKRIISGHMPKGEGHFKHWDTEEICSYLRQHGLGDWEQKFRGHGPFSHMFDGMFIPKVRPGLKWKHEQASVQMFDHLVKVNNLEKWPYEGRTEEKSFLYEIVANKRTGVDVDKWDYFARSGALQERCTGSLKPLMIWRPTPKLTDHIFEQILYSSDPELSEAQDILQNILCRRLYKCVGQTTPDTHYNVSQEMLRDWSHEVSKCKPDGTEVDLNPEDFVVSVSRQNVSIATSSDHLLPCRVINMDYGMKEKNPVNNVYFYCKNEPSKAIKIHQNQDGDVTAPELTPLKRDWQNKDDDDSGDDDIRDQKKVNSGKRVKTNLFPSPQKKMS
ncbi:Deoxynucleoside triphosphate triphosphohydrolase SAMHD1 [Bagarius yarrelli]|uniref:Deoxynucleoside triphosphate triphosphohydrolase SAMHD1 n=1 Tax=Bagarius yarrelli TaxID=175774 RepID=A0A556UYT6_BAGYA|nr:Deoxynucleoside triphosphate triphosphohydrolase SAMHD1 [Bagarius yarrelli]